MAMSRAAAADSDIVSQGKVSHYRTDDEARRPPRPPFRYFWLSRSNPITTQTQMRCLLLKAGVKKMDWPCSTPR